ncbi:MAG: fibrobacter succinogenes major paralogous domain-containing protein [Bacteroidales bacterium]|nr:fibrobacter succinogenes major paralogous domain-containing protein [Bacteroidales bacterium]
MSVPYALYSKTASNGFSGKYIDLTGRPDFSKWDKDSTDNITITGDQTISGNKAFTGITTVSTPVNATDAATKAYVDALLDKVQLLQAEIGVTDIDGNHYKAVKIGNQVWMAENLKVTKYNDGTEIPLVTTNDGWTALNSPAYCWYNNNEGVYKDTYGALYNWYAASTSNLCPVGWHVPTDSEWTTLTDYLIANGYNYDGTITGNKVAKALAFTSEWTLSTVTGAIGNADFPEKRNITGFTAVPGGYRYYVGGICYNIGNFGIWWSSSSYNDTMAWKRLMKYENTDLNWSLSEKPQGSSVRCIRD